MYQKALEDRFIIYKGGVGYFPETVVPSTAVWVAQTTEVHSFSSGGWKSKVMVSAGFVPSGDAAAERDPGLSSSIRWQLATLRVSLFRSLPPSAQSCPPPCVSPPFLIRLPVVLDQDPQPSVTSN